MPKVPRRYREELHPSRPPVGVFGPGARALRTVDGARRWMVSGQGEECEWGKLQFFAKFIKLRDAKVEKRQKQFM